MSVDTKKETGAEVSTKLKRAREGARLSVRELAQACDLSKSYVSALENGTRHASEELAGQILSTISRLSKQRESAIRHAVASAFYKPELRALRLRHGFVGGE